jgi:hypothetical protein
MAVLHHQTSRGKFAVLVHGNEIWNAMESARAVMRCPVPSRIRIFHAHKQPEGSFKYLFCLAAISDLASDDRAVKQLKKFHIGKYLLFTENSGPESISEVTAELDIRSPDRIHTPRFQVDDLASFCRRFIGSLCSTDHDQSILDAWWEKDRLAIRSATLQRLKVPISVLPRRIQAASDQERSAFQIDDDGDMIHWPELDIDMGWSQFQQAVNPNAALRARQQDKEFNIAYGAAIKSLREGKNINQSAIEGLDARQIRRIEHGETRATANAIRKLAQAHEMTPNEYMNEIAGRMEARPKA